MPEPTGEIDLLIAFLNTHDIEAGRDAIATPAELKRWLASKGLLKPVVMVEEQDVHLAQVVREGLRALLAHRNASKLTDGLDTALRSLPLRLTVGAGGQLALMPVAAPRSLPALGNLAAVLATGATGSDWHRLKVCQNPDCQWAFYDASKNLSHRWCSMGVCGNRVKARAYRTRRRAESQS